VAFQPFLAMNDYTGLAPALLAGGGIGELPPVVQPELVRSGRLVEVMPDWRLRTFDLFSRSSRKPAHFKAMPALQGIRDANGIDAFSQPSNL